MPYVEDDDEVCEECKLPLDLCLCDLDEEEDDDEF